MATDTLPHASIIGAVVPRIDGPLKTSGTARYAVDHHFPGLVHAVAVQSTIGSGRIRSLDASAALGLTGVGVDIGWREPEPGHAPEAVAV